MMARKATRLATHEDVSPLAFSGNIAAAGCPVKRSVNESDESGMGRDESGKSRDESAASAGPSAGWRRVVPEDEPVGDPPWRCP